MNYPTQYLFEKLEKENNVIRDIIEEMAVRISDIEEKIKATEMKPEDLLFALNYILKGGVMANKLIEQIVTTIDILSMIEKERADMEKTYKKEEIE